MKLRLPALAPHQVPWHIRMLYRYLAKQYGQVPEPFSVMAVNPKLLYTNLIHEAALMRSQGAIDKQLTHLAVFRVAQTVGCSWCVDFGEMLGKLDGLRLDHLTDIDDYQKSPAFTDDERLVIAYTDAATATPSAVTDEQVAQLRDRFGDPGVIELTYLIGVENERCRVNAALGATDQGFSSGDACRVPWANSTVPQSE